MSTPVASAMDVTSGVLAVAGSSRKRLSRKGSNMPIRLPTTTISTIDRLITRAICCPPRTTPITPMAQAMLTPQQDRQYQFPPEYPGPVRQAYLPRCQRPYHQGRGLRAGIAPGGDQDRQEEHQRQVGGNGVLEVRYAGTRKDAAEDQQHQDRKSVV